MIRMRDDDVLVATRSFASSFERFKEIHQLIARVPQMIHVPAVIIDGGANDGKGLEDYPECIEYIRTETLEGRMAPEFHAMFHVDPAKLSEQHVCEHLEEGIEWMQREFACTPERWYTPWGADNEMLRAAAEKYGMQLVGVDRHWQIHRVLARQADNEQPAELDGQEVSFHWWEGGARVARLCSIVRHGSWGAAKEAERELFR